ncbi:kinase-like protein [Peniophora sp. CONT]|nr:kinase-like protein [Peniophora sp. CONT]
MTTNTPDTSDLFGQLIPFKNGKLIRRWAISLRKDDFSYSIGTHKDCDITIRGFRSVEPYHCTVHYDGITGVVSVKNGSLINGTWVNSALLSGAQDAMLRDNDKIGLGAPVLPSSRIFVFESRLPEGDTLARSYSVDWHKPIGNGSFGMVWKARKRRSYGPKSYRAVKALYFEAGDMERRTQIAEELKICSSLVHPNICTFYEAIQDAESNKMYIVLELVPDGNLDQYVNKVSRASLQGIGIALAQQITRQICAAVKYMHELSIVHRDLKPANILIDISTPTAPLIKVTDFGLSKKMINAMPMKTVCGTPDFVAPEVMGSYYGKSVDSWSIGAIVVFMLTRNTPFVWTTLKGRDLWLNMACRRVDLSTFERTVKQDHLSRALRPQISWFLPPATATDGPSFRFPRHFPSTSPSLNNYMDPIHLEGDEEEEQLMSDVDEERPALETPVVRGRDGVRNLGISLSDERRVNITLEGNGTCYAAGAVGLVCGTEKFIRRYAQAGNDVAPMTGVSSSTESWLNLHPCVVSPCSKKVRLGFLRHIQPTFVCSDAIAVDDLVDRLENEYTNLKIEANLTRMQHSLTSDSEIRFADNRLKLKAKEAQHRAPPAIFGAFMNVNAAASIARPITTASSITPAVGKRSSADVHAIGEQIRGVELAWVLSMGFFAISIL